MSSFKSLYLILAVLFLSACSANTAKNSTSQSVQTPSASMPMGSISRVDVGTIVQLKKVIKTNDASLADSGNIGISVGSGGHAGIFGTIDAGKVIRALSRPPKQLEIVIKKASGEYVSVTQKLGGNFKVGDKVKVLLRNGRAVVEH